MEYIKQLFELLNQDNNPTIYHKKTDDYIEEIVDPASGGVDDLSIPFAAPTESDRIQEFIQDTCDYFTLALGGRRLRYTNDLYHGMARIGDGVQSPLFWCVSLRHPVGFMLNENGVEPMRLVDLNRYGIEDVMAVYMDGDVKNCIDSIVDMLREHRHIQLVVEPEKENGSAAAAVENSNIKKE